MDDFREWTISTCCVETLCWQGDALVDWVGRGMVHFLDGSSEPVPFAVPFPFDAAIPSPSGRFTLLYQRLGTKGLILDDQGEGREINRSYYCAHTYEYPAALFRLPDGREVLAHCPERYNRLEIEDLATGERLTRAEDRRPADFLHSRLAANPSGTLLLSAGWLWRSWDAVRAYDVQAALADPTALDGEGVLPHIPRQARSAAFADDSLLVVVEGAGLNQPAGEEPETLAVYDLATGKCLSRAPAEAPVGTLMPVPPERVVGFYEHPKLFDLATGRVLHAWPDILTGRQNSSILHGTPPPPMALDPQRRRFAVAEERRLRVLQVG